MTRRYVIIGAGAVGALLAAQLSSADIPVLLVARGEHLARIRADGLRVRRPERDDVVRLETAGAADEVRLRGSDVLVLATKAQDAEDALAHWAWKLVALDDGGEGVAADLPILTFQNGLATEALALRRFRQVYGVSIAVPASYLVPGEVAVASDDTVGQIVIGRYPTGSGPLQDAFVEAFAAAGYRTEGVADIRAWKAGKLLNNVNNALDVLSGTAEERSELRRLVAEEASRVFAGAGITVAQRDEQWRRPTSPRTVPGYEQRKLSTWQSYRRGASSEVDFLNGEIVLLGREHGVRTPVNEAIQRLLGRQAHLGLPPDTHSLQEILRGVEQ